MKFVNLTPHPITLFDQEDHSVKLEIMPSGKVARVITVENFLRPVDGIPIMSLPIPGPILNLPDPEPGTGYIVSLLVLQHPDACHREDVFAPATGPEHAAVRDQSGRLVGVTRLIRGGKHPQAQEEI